MIGDFPIVTFDTTVHNRLVDDGPLSEALLAGLKSGLFFRFAGLSLDELVATPDPKVFVAHGEAPPSTFRQAITRLQGEGSLIWSMGKLLYDRAAETDASEATIKEFMKVCPPFRALIYAMLLSWYDRSVRHRHTGEKFPSRP